MFKNLMIHKILQFTRLIVFRYALHRCESQEIHYQEFILDLFVCLFFFFIVSAKQYCYTKKRGKWLKVHTQTSSLFVFKLSKY